MVAAGPSSTAATPMTARSRGRGLFIVDNSVSGWTGLRYLKEWTGIAKAFDIATGYFEIGALLALDGKWQGLDRIRILMGAETTHRTRKALLEAVRRHAIDRLDRSLEENKKPNPFLHGVPAVLKSSVAGDSVHPIWRVSGLARPEDGASPSVDARLRRTRPIRTVGRLKVGDSGR